MKRMTEDDGSMSTESTPTKRSRASGDMELRILIQSKSAGSIIGKGGSNISRLRSEYPASITIPDCPGPERVCSISGPENAVLKLLEEVLKALDESVQSSGESEVRMLVHQSQAGAIIGKGGSKIKELREVCGGTVKVYGNVCPQSTDRVIQIIGDQQRVLLTAYNILDALKECSIKGIDNQYNPLYCDEFFAQEYGGWGDPNKGRFGPINVRGPMNGPGGPMGGPMGGGGGGGGGGAGNRMSMGPGGPMGPSGGMPPPFGGDRRNRIGPFSPPRNGPMHNMRGGDDYDDMMMPNNGNNSKGFLNGGSQSLMGTNSENLTTSTQVTIPKEAAGAIIGKGGNRIRKIRNESCCAISIEDARPGCDDRIITITGSDQQIKHAQYLLQQSVREYGGPHVNSGGGGGGGNSRRNY